MKLNLIFISLILSVFILIFSTLILIYDFSFYEKQAFTNGVYHSFGNKTYVDSLYFNLINYFYQGNLQGFTDEREISHLADVKSFIKLLEVLFLILLITLILLLYSYRNSLSSIFMLSFFMILLFCVLLFLFNFINFNFLFDSFHRLLFIQDSWKFYEGYLLLSLFPQQFFINSLIRILQYSLFFGFFIFSLGILVKQK